MSRQDFIKEIAPVCQDLGKQYDLLPSFIIGVACHESNFGDSGLSKKANNLFGIKGSFQNKYVVMQTAEYKDGKRITVDARFRKYPSYRESITDFCELIENGVSWNREIYHSVIGVKDPKEVTEKFGKTPYMTDPKYPSKLFHIMEEYKLMEYDQKTERDDSRDSHDELNVPYPNLVLKRGSRGNLVKLLQAKLGIEEDGIFGDITESYVTVYQHKNKLKIDGIVGLQTWTSLFK